MPRNDYQRRQDDRRSRLEKRATRATSEAQSRFAAAARATAGIPVGQPVLVGHHSERHHRAALERSDRNMRAGIAAHDQAAAIRGRAASVGTGGISSDDPEALRLLRQKLASEEAQREQIKATNAAWRKGGWDAAAAFLGWSPERVVTERARLKSCGEGDGPPFPAYLLSNLGNNIRRIEKRIADLERELARQVAGPAAPVEGPGWRIEERPDLNRIAIAFDVRPPDEVLALLGGCGFRWSSREGAHLRQLNEAGRRAARAVAAHLARPPIAAEGNGAAPSAPPCACLSGGYCDVSHDPAACPCGRCNSGGELSETGGGDA